MPVRRLETLAFITEDDEQPFEMGPTRADLLRGIYTAYSLPRPQMALIAGSGKGEEVVGLYLFSPATHITAVDRNVQLSREVIQLTNARYVESFLHEFKLSCRETYDAIIISTGPSHGISTREEYSALARAVSPKGIILTNWDALLDLEQMELNGFTYKNIGQLYAGLPHLYQRR